MIVSYNVCDFCGNQSEIGKTMCSGINVSWCVRSAYKADRITKYSDGTFCDINCFIEFVKKSIKKEKNDASK